MLSMHWIVATHKKEGAVSVSVAGKTYQPKDATTIELPDPPVYAEAREAAQADAFELLGHYEGPLWRRFMRSLTTPEVIQGRPISVVPLALQPLWCVIDLSSVRLWNTHPVFAEEAGKAQERIEEGQRRRKIDELPIFHAGCGSEPAEVAYAVLPSFTGLDVEGCGTKDLAWVIPGREQMRDHLRGQNSDHRIRLDALQ